KYDKGRFPLRSLFIAEAGGVQMDDDGRWQLHGTAPAIQTAIQTIHFSSVAEYVRLYGQQADARDAGGDNPRSHCVTKDRGDSCTDISARGVHTACEQISDPPCNRTRLDQTDYLPRRVACATAKVGGSDDQRDRYSTLRVRIDQLAPPALAQREAHVLGLH